MSDSQLNKLKLGIKNNTKVIEIGNSNYETNFPQKLLLIDWQVSSWE